MRGKSIIVEWHILTYRSSFLCTNIGRLITFSKIDYFVYTTTNSTTTTNRPLWFVRGLLQKCCFTGGNFFRQSANDDSLSDIGDEALMENLCNFTYTRRDVQRGNFTTFLHTYNTLVHSNTSYICRCTYSSACMSQADENSLCRPVVSEDEYVTVRTGMAEIRYM